MNNYPTTQRDAITGLKLAQSFMKKSVLHREMLVTDKDVQSMAQELIDMLEQAVVQAHLDKIPKRER